MAGDTMIQHMWISYANSRWRCFRRRTSGRQWSRPFPEPCKDQNKNDDESHIYQWLVSHDCVALWRGNLPHPMNHFDRIRPQIVGGDNRGILRERKTGEKPIYNGEALPREFGWRRPALIGIHVHIDSHTGVVVMVTAVLISAAIYDPRMCGRLCFGIDSRHDVRVNWSDNDKNHIHSQNASAEREI